MVAALFVVHAETTLLLAPVVGAYLILSALGVLLGRAGFVDDLRDHPAVLHAVGALAFLVGAGIVSFHRDWSSPADATVSLTGCWWALEGAGLLAAPNAFKHALGHPRYEPTFRVMNIAGLAVGGYLASVAVLGRMG